MAVRLSALRAGRSLHPGRLKLRLVFGHINWVEPLRNTIQESHLHFVLTVKKFPVPYEEEMSLTNPLASHACNKPIRVLASYPVQVIFGCI
jgi:hypothetical protein